MERKVDYCTSKDEFVIKNNVAEVIKSDTKKLEQIYKERFKDF